MHYKRIAFFAVVIILLMIINNLGQSLYSVWQKQDLIKRAQQDLEDSKKENQKLKSDLAKVQQSDFIETEARDKLYLTKPGESIVVIPAGSIKIKPSVTPPPKDTRKNWQKWVDTFIQPNAAQK